MTDYNTKPSNESEDEITKIRKWRLENATITEARFGEEYGIGKIISREGPGDGYASYPWALDEYERDLGLTPRETWLLKRLVRHAWNFGDPAYPSMRKVSRNAIISSTTLKKTIESLIRKGYIVVLSNGEGVDRRKRYDIRGFYFALTYAIESNPDSKRCKRIKKVRILPDRLPNEIVNMVSEDLQTDKRITVGMINEIVNSKGFLIDWRNCRLHEIHEWKVRAKKLTSEEVMCRIGNLGLDLDG